MISYTPKPIPSDSTALPAFLNTELAHIANVVNQASGLPMLYAPPTKPFNGQHCYADGTHWNPDGVHGQGIYYYKIVGSTGSWIHIA